MTAEQFFKEHNRAAIAFSGGVDSAYLLYLAKQCGADVKAYFVNSDFQPAFELEDAVRVAEHVGVPLVVIPLDALADDVKCNPKNRCYFCKKHIFGALIERAKEDGYTEIFDGTNASDDADDRPGMKALSEMKVLSPLRLCGITKQMVRQAAKAAGIHVWDKPSYACLATRVPTGTEITKELLVKVEAAETALMERGFSDFRVRVQDEKTARLEIREEQFEKLFAERRDIMNALGEHFPGVYLNMKARTARES